MTKETKESGVVDRTKPFGLLKYTRFGLEVFLRGLLVSCRAGFCEFRCCLGKQSIGEILSDLLHNPICFQE